MAKDILRNDINELLDMIRYQFSIIESHEGKIPQIEMDIIMSNVRKLYDDFFELNKLNQRYTAEPLQEKKVPAEPEKEQERNLTGIHFPVKEEKTEKAEQQQAIPEASVTEQHTGSVKESIKPKETYKSPQKKTSAADLFSAADNIPISEKFKDEKKSLHDRILSEKKDKSIAETIITPIADLRTGIGVNDRFLFINELFKGSMQDYNTAIEEINKQPSLEGAVQQFNILKELYEWKADTEEMNRLMNFINRRFK